MQMIWKIHSKGTSRVVAMVVLAVLISATTGSFQSLAEKKEEENKMIQIDPNKVSAFYDTDNDGMGEFEGFGTSLCWWANRIGNHENLTQKAGELFFHPEKGLGMNIGRYNLGGGDLVGDAALIESAKTDESMELSEFLHADHIIRSDSAVPGYCVDVTRIDTSQKTIEEYQEQFDRVDETSGFAWNYNWDADKGQMNVLKAAIENGGEDFVVEIFSNSPPYFMTESGCSSGNMIANNDNLRKDCYEAFAKYIADVMEYWSQNGIHFQSVSPMNEPYTNYWGAYSSKQEGCHFDIGESQSNILVALDAQMKEKGLTDVILAASDETSIDIAALAYKNLTSEAKQAIGRIDTHTYGGTRREELKELALSENKNLWMSEVDGSFTAGTNAGEMSAALGIGQRIIEDLNGLKASAWILWNAIDMHVDSSEYGKTWVDKGSNNDFLSKESLYASWIPDDGCGYWGLAAANHDTGEIYLTKKYYGFGQFSKFIRPGYTIMETTEMDKVIAAYAPTEGKVVIVAMNTSSEDEVWTFDLSLFGNIDQNAGVTAVRTSGSLENGENWADVSEKVNIIMDVSGKTVSTTVKANSITTYTISGISLSSTELDEQTEQSTETESEVVTESTKQASDEKAKVFSLIALAGCIVFGTAVIARRVFRKK